ncbi:tetratricopeptide repeat protein [Streptomyces sp. NPDC002589]|uniref:tetratricopeptide repeat protein n=1 Tax=Streptomyces sp. NPDC002589 TaxID=3154420 RepID=UPI0033231D73
MSTLRTLGDPRAGAGLLLAEREQPSNHPDDAVTAFLALACVDLGRERDAACSHRARSPAICPATTPRWLATPRPWPTRHEQLGQARAGQLCPPVTGTVRAPPRHTDRPGLARRSVRPGVSRPLLLSHGVRRARGSGRHARPVIARTPADVGPPQPASAAACSPCRAWSACPTLPGEGEPRMSRHRGIPPSAPRPSPRSPRPLPAPSARPGAPPQRRRCQQYRLRIADHEDGHPEGPVRPHTREHRRQRDEHRRAQPVDQSPTSRSTGAAWDCWNASAQVAQQG